MAGLMLFTNNAATTLASSITNVATSLTVATGTGTLFPTISGGQYFYVTLANNAGTVEIVKCTARTTDTFTVTRAQDGTSAVSWTAGDKVELRLVRADLTNFGQLDSTNTWTQAQTFPSGQALIAPVLGTPTSGTLTNTTGLPLTTGVTGTLPIANGGTNNSSLGVTDGGIVYADGTRLQTTAAGTSGQVLTSAGAGIPTWTTITSGGMTLLGTISTASGTSVSLTGLTLTSYKQLTCVFNSVVMTAVAGVNFTLNSINLVKGGAKTYVGQIFIDLTSGAFSGSTGVTAGTASEAISAVGSSGLTTASTSITFGTSGTTPAFGGGSILVFGVK